MRDHLLSLIYAVLISPLRLPAFICRTTPRMESETTFGPVPDSLLQAPPGTPRASAMAPVYGELRRLNSAFPRGRTAPHTWGWTILRTVYTPESDRGFGAAADKLQRWLAYYVNIRKSPAARCGAVWPAEPVDELARRLRNDLVQDREQLDAADWGVVHDVFRHWVLQQGVVEDDLRRKVVPSNVRYNSCIVIDQAALEALEEHLPEDTPPLTEPMVLTSDAWVWVFCAKSFEEQGQGISHESDGYRGWMRVPVERLFGYWSMRMTWGKRYGLPHEEDQNEKGVYWYD